MSELPFPLEPVSPSQPSMTLMQRGALLFALLSVIAGSAAIAVGGYTFWKWQQQPLDPIVCSQGEVVAQLYVDVAGSVVRPGLHAVPLGSRIGDAIAQAGGIAEGADPQFVQQSLNLSDPVKDGQKLYVPSLAERQQVFAASESSSVSSNSTPSKSGSISINTATAKDLQSLPGIGEKRAADIIAGRPFSALSELVERKILTNALFSELETVLSL